MNLLIFTNAIFPIDVYHSFLDNSGNVKEYFSSFINVGIQIQTNTKQTNKL